LCALENGHSSRTNSLPPCQGFSARTAIPWPESQAPRSNPAVFCRRGIASSRGMTPATAPSRRGGTAAISSGAEISLERRCGRSGVESPFRETVP